MSKTMKCILILLSVIICALPAQAQNVTTYYQNGHRIIIDRRVRQTPVQRFGYNGDVGATEEDLWSVGATYTGWLQADSTVRVAAGGNAADDAGAAGCQQVTVTGLDANWDVQSVNITTNGADASTASSETFIRVNGAYCSSVGTYGGLPTADIDIETTGGTVLARIESNTGRAEMAMYSVPRGHVFMVETASFRVNASNTADISIHRRDSGNDVATPFGSNLYIYRLIKFTGTHEEEFHGSIVYDEYTDIWVSAVRTSGSAAEVAVDLNGWLIRI